MEVFFNFAWAALALAIVLSWLRSRKRTPHGRWLQIVSLGVLIAVLFPVISVSDDLMAAQNPAETDSCQRRDHLVAPGVHPELHAVLGTPGTFFEGPSLGQPYPAALDRRPIPASDPPQIPATQNRPPPTA